MSKYLVQEGVTDVTDATDPKPRDAIPNKCFAVFRLRLPET